ncbi:Y2899-like protein [Mya arenaria]|uniref:Y2899-like protein n=1 Tax=Mya arenaria TaxID=6604 RepID=A0ABY7FKS2_MYAAR|nr:Y2899-like protein [Mya arenaria]
MSGNWYQLEWTWNKIDTIMREQVYAQTKVQTKLQLKEFKRRRQPDTYDANQDEGPDESRAPIPKPRKSKDLSETKTTEKHSDNHPQIKPSGAKHHEDDGVRPISVPSMHQSLHDDHASSFLHDRSRDADHRSSILHDRSRDGDHASSFLHERSGDGDHASRFVYDRSGDGNHASSILHDQNRDKVLHSDHPSSILHDRTRDKGSKKHVEVEPSDWDDPGHVHHGHKGMHVHFSASAESSHREHSQIKVKRDIYILTKNPDEIKFLDFEFGPVTVNVYVGLITMAETDVIVNAAMGSLVNGGGVAWAIASNASPELQKQCDEFVKTKGNLQTSEVMHTCAGGKLNPNVKNVIHAVGPIWSRVVGEKICTHQLIMAFLNSFSYGNDILKISTISVPLISSAEGAGRLLTDAEQLMSEAAHATAVTGQKLELEDDGDRMRIPSRTEVSRPEVMMQSGAKTSTQKPSKAPQIDVTNMPETGSVHEPVPAWRPLPPAPKSEKSHSKKKK